MVGHGVACYGAADRYLGMLAATLGDDDSASRHFEAALTSTGRWARHLARAHRLRVRAHAAAPGRLRSRGAAAHRGRAPRRDGGDADACSRVSERCTHGVESRRCRTASPSASSRCFGWWRAVAPIVRSGPRCSSASTPPPTTFAAFSARPRARTAPRRRPTHIDAAWPRAERRRSIQHMPMYVIERAFAEQLDLTSEDVKLIEEINADEGVRWLFSFLSADKRRSYCLYEAPSPDMILAAAKRAGIPADAVVEVESHLRGHVRVRGLGVGWDERLSGLWRAGRRHTTLLRPLRGSARPNVRGLWRGQSTRLSLLRGMRRCMRHHGSLTVGHRRAHRWGAALGDRHVRRPVRVHSAVGAL